MLSGSIVFVCNLEDAGVEIVKQLPAGLPPLQPLLPYSALPYVWHSVLTLSCAGFMESFAIQQGVAQENGDAAVDPDAELSALGWANLASSWTGGFAVAGDWLVSKRVLWVGVRFQNLFSSLRLWCA